MPPNHPATADSPVNTLSAEDLDRLRQCGDRLEFRDGQEILHEGQHNAALYLVERGTLHAYRQVSQRRVFLGYLEPGSVFGEISLFDPGPTTATVAATADGELLEITAERFRQFAEAAPQSGIQLLLALSRQMAARLRRTDERLVDAIMWGGLRR